MIHTKHVLFVVTSFILAALIYSSSPTFVVFVQGKPVWGAHIDCTNADFFSETCCWAEDFGTYIAYVCQTCYDRDGYGSTGYEDCGPLEKQRTVKGGDVTAPLGEGVLQQPLTTPTTPTPPLFGRNVGNAPLAGGVLEQPTTIPLPTPPPLFGRNDANVLQGGVILEQPLTTITPTTPVPTPPPLFGQIAPEGQVPLTADEGTLPPTVGEQRIPTEVKEPPSEEQGIEEEGQVIARDEDGDDGDDDGPVPPECPLTGPIPPDCTMKPFPPKKALE
jgi:hypothetical protein